MIARVKVSTPEFAECPRCGETHRGDGFYFCDEAGNEVMKPGPGWPGLYRCTNCEVIIEVVTSGNTP